MTPTRRIGRAELVSAAPLLALAAVVLAGIAVRVWTLTTPIGRLDGDEGVTGVMAQRILDGHFPAFFGSQNYQGALEQYLQAGVLWLLPDTPFTLRIVQVALCAVILVLTYLLASRVTMSRWAGVLAAAVLAVGPYYFTVKGVRSHGGYDGAIIACLVMTLAVLALRRGGGRTALWAFIAGVAAGVGLWENPTALYMVIPAAFWALGAMRGSLRRALPLAVGGLLIGLLPAILHFAANGISAPARTDQQPDSTFLERLGYLFDPVIPDFLGVSSSIGPANPGMPATAIGIAAVVAIAAATWHRRRGLWHLVTLRADRCKPIDLILLTFLITPVLYAASPFTWFTGEPRYLFVLYPFAAAAFVTGVMAIRVREFRMAATVTALLGAAFLPATALAEVARTGGAIITVNTGVLYVEDLPEVADAMVREGVTTAYANYWIAGPLQFATGNRVQVAAGNWTQFPEIDEQVRRSARTAIVVPTLPGAGKVRPILVGSGRTFREFSAGRFTVFADINPPWRVPPLSFVVFPG